jgi:bifunctional N-acetylglucosamine-1-phosphate-uridyltransferase/glucosamine-1-phosphate-acetyltransferase GlmU-like protein
MNCIILAYKKEEAMKSITPIYLHDLLDKPMIDYVLESTVDFKRTLIVSEEESVQFDKYKEQCNLVKVAADSQLGAIISEHAGKEPTLVVLGNLPNVSKEVITEFVQTFEASKAQAASLTVDNKQVGVFAFASSLSSGSEEKKEVQPIKVKNTENVFPIADRFQLSLAENNMRLDIIKRHLYNGVTVKNIDSVTIGPDVEIGEDTIVFPNSYITGKVSIGVGCKLGPFVRIRHSAELADGVKIGNFVELKNAKMGKKSASAHLSYLGDTTIGNEVNIGCGVITVNYDGANKHHTYIEDDAFIGCNTNLVAPVTIGKSSLVAAGSTVTKDVPEKNLAFARARQINKRGYERKRKQK